MKILYIFRGKMAQKALRYTAGQVPDDFLYGMNHLKMPGVEVSSVIAPREKRVGWLRKITYFIELPFTLASNTGFPIDIYLMFKNEIKQANILFCVNDATGLGILFWKAFGMFDGKVIVLAQSLSERYKSVRPKFVNSIIKWLLMSSSHILVLSEAAKEGMVKYYGVCPDKITVFHFGVDQSFWSCSPKVHRKDFILSVGNDSNRDYPTLIDACKGKYHLKLVTRQQIRTTGDNNIEVLNGITDKELRKLYCEANVVVVPNKRVETESSGLSVALQAMACKTPVIISRSPALKEYFFENSVGCETYISQDVNDLQRVLKRVYSGNVFENRTCNTAGRSIQKFTSSNMGGQLRKIITRLI